MEIVILDYIITQVLRSSLQLCLRAFQIFIGLFQFVCSLAAPMLQDAGVLLQVVLGFAATWKCCSELEESCRTSAAVLRKGLHQIEA